MANGFGSLYIGAAGLRSAQNALNTTANNMSNVDTKGYVRQQVRYADMNYTILKTTSANVNLQQSGLGVSIGDVVHARDVFIDKTYRQEEGRRDFYGARYEVASYVEDMMQELNGQEFKQSVTDLWQAFQELSTKVDISIYQNLVVEKAELLVSRSQKLYSDMQNYQMNINEQIRDDVHRVNEIGNKIYELNLEIQKVEAAGIETAMTLRDARDNLLDELGCYGKIDVIEDSTGFVYVDFESTQFIDENRCYNIGLQEDKGTGFFTPYWTQLSNVSANQYVPVFRTDMEISSEMNTDVGSIKSKLILRGDGYGKASDLKDEASYDKIALSTMMKTEAQLDKLFTDIVTKMNNLFAPNIDAASDATLAGAAAANGDITGQLDDGTNFTFNLNDAKILDAENCPRGVDGKLPPRELFVRAGCDRYTKVNVSGKEYYVYNEEVPTDMNTRYAIGSIGINEDLIRQITLMPAYKADGAVDYEFGAKLAAAWEKMDMKLNPYDQKPCTMEGYYNRIVAELGTEGNTYKTIQETLEGSVNYYDNERQKVTGVSSDEELTSMIKFQSAYNAASRFMTVISQMTELIVTGLI